MFASVRSERIESTARGDQKSGAAAGKLRGMAGERVSARFGPFTLDTDRRLLQRDNVDVHLTPKAFDLLVLLIQEAPRVLRKAELHERLWRGTFVSDATLVGLIKEIRRQLDDRNATSRLVRTAFGVGYAFCGTVESTVLPPGRRTPDIGGQSWWIVAGGRNIPLSEGEHVIGRDPASTVWLDVPGVSRRHARIVIDREGASIEDLDSKNGTTLRDQTLTGPSPLHDGDRIQVGQILVVFHASASGPSTTTLTGRTAQPRRERRREED